MANSLIAKYKPMLESFPQLNNKQLAAVTHLADKALITALSEATYNLCIIGAIPLSEQDKKFFRKRGKLVLVAGNAKNSIAKRRQIFSMTPDLTRKIAECVKSFI